MTLPLPPDTLTRLLATAATLLGELRLAGTVIRGWLRSRPPVGAYETIALDLVLDLPDPTGERAVLTRRQTVRFLAPDAEVVRELVWGEGEQFARHRARGARRLLVRAEGSRQAALLGFDRRPTRGERRTLTTRRTITGGFRAPTEYCETFLERSTGRVTITVIFPPGRPPRDARLVAVPGEPAVRRIPVRYRPDGRAMLRCRLHRPAPATTYSLQWSW